MFSNVDLTKNVCLAVVPNLGMYGVSPNSFRPWIVSAAKIQLTYLIKNWNLPQLFKFSTISLFPNLTLNILDLAKFLDTYSINLNFHGFVKFIGHFFLQNIGYAKRNILYLNVQRSHLGWRKFRINTNLLVAMLSRLFLGKFWYQAQYISLDCKSLATLYLLNIQCLPGCSGQNFSVQCITTC